MSINLPTLPMSLLHKNAILKEYRRQHREGVVVDSAAAYGKHNLNNENIDDEFPDVTAFKVIGGSSSASPLCVRPSSRASVTAMMGKDNGGATSTTTTGNPNTRVGGVERGKVGAGNGKLGPLPLGLRAGFQGEDSAAAAGENDRSTADWQRRTNGGGSPKCASADQSSNTAQGDKDCNSGKVHQRVDGHADADHFSPPLAPVNRNTRGGAAAAASPPALRAAPARQSSSDLTGEDDHEKKDSYIYSSGMDTTVSMPTLATGVETFLSASDAADGATATYGPSLRVASGMSVQGSHNHTKNKNGSIGRANRTASGAPLSPSSSKPRRHVNPTIPQLSASMSLLSAPQVAYDSSRVDDGDGQVNVEVSSSSSSEASRESKPVKHHTSYHQSALSEEAVGKLCLNVTGNSLECETLVTGGSPGGVRLDASDTMLQPPTSILSEPSTLDTTTANLASLRSLSYARRTMDRHSGAGRLQQSRGGPAVQVPPPQCMATAASTANREGGEDDVFSQVSAAEAASSPTNVAASLEPTPAAAGPSHMLSFTDTVNTFPRIGGEEDIDVDPSSMYTDNASCEAVITPPITFYEAFVELIKDMRRFPAANGCAHGGSATPSEPHAAPRASQRENLENKNKRTALGWLFGCCRPRESDVKTHQRSAYAGETDLDRTAADFVHSQAAATTTAANSSGAGTVEDDLQVVQFLKSCPLSLQSVTHRRMLITVFSVLTGQVPWPNSNQKAVLPVNCTVSPSMRSVRWELIGFQGSDPATDVRATGVLGVLQLLYLIDYYPAFAKCFWGLCRNPSGVNSSTCGSGTISSPQMSGRLSNELPFVLVCFNFTALVLDAAGQHWLDSGIEKAKRRLLAPAVPMIGSDKPEAHLASWPGMFVCCEAFVGALGLFSDAWCARRRAERDAPGSMPDRSSVACFGDVKAKLRAQILAKKGAALLLDAEARVRDNAFRGFE
ncbi:hypothetical protein ABL78_2626 [Leptomonas seymouri]|uniref:ELMO domain-containing protein n=1 Tax=Leptomonas seymouri TaxID=5684 RepID=A0A0N1PDB6_LEPSE|nr:hypothetical protein ABL78_2626 [Leptomonas seymouri]|eukprot:KPI88264.1 hypothetical protein ABL78_2626 [Leptomonas seymouri]